MKNKNIIPETKNKDFFKLKDVSVCRELALRQRVRILLLRLGISQSKLADRIGITRQTLNRIVNGDWRPTSQIKIRMAQELEVDSLVLFGATEYWEEWREKIGYPNKEKGK